MQFQLTDEQRALQDAVRSYLRDRFGPSQVRELFENDTDGVPADLWKAVNEQGWLAVLVPEEHDGLGLGLLDASVIARAFGAGTVPGPWQSTLLAGEAIRPAPQLNATIDASYITGIGSVADRMLILMDIEALMSSNDMGLMDDLG